MDGTLALRHKAIDDYRPHVEGDLVDEIHRLAAPLEGLRVLHLSVTAFGTGVAELLNGAVPLLDGLGLDCRWQVMRSADEFVNANKALYRALAGSETDWSPDMVDAWRRYNEMNASFISEPFDVIVVHDPQPAAVRRYAGHQHAKWILHCHLDLSSANEPAWRLLEGYIQDYDALVFDAQSFVHTSLRREDIAIIPPAIDPLGPRNMDLGRDAIDTILQRYGLHADRPLMSQVAPCEPASDLLGVIDVHDKVRQKVPGLQLVLIVSNPPEDAASIAYFNEVVRKSMEYSDVHILRGVSEVGNVEINALQSASDIVLQKGLRKGFGIWLCEAQWKGRPVIATRDGVLAHLVIDGETGFLADSTEAFAERAVQLLTDPDMARRLGQAGRQRVAKQYLLPRFVADELRLLARLTGGRRA
jgi:trehalose synthase